MSLKALPVAVKPTAAKSKKSDKPEFSVDGTKLKRYAALKASMADIEAEVKELEPVIRETGLRGICGFNIENPGAPTSSVKLVDESGARVMVTMQNRYSSGIDPAVADEVFARHGGDINNHMQMTVAASFNSKIFVAAEGTPGAGEFSKKVYDVYLKAIEDATAKLRASGHLPADAVSPLSSKPVASVRENFHADRWSAYADVDAQLEIQAVVPATVTLKAIVD